MAKYNFSWDNPELPIALKNAVNTYINTSKNGEFDRKATPEFIQNMVESYTHDPSASEDEQRCRMTNVINMSRQGVPNIATFNYKLNKGYTEGPTNYGTKPIPAEITPVIARTYIARKAINIMNILMSKAKESTLPVWERYHTGRIPAGFPGHDNPKIVAKFFSGKIHTVGSYFKKYLEENDSTSSYIRLAECVITAIMRTRYACIVVPNGNAENQFSAFVTKVFGGKSLNVRCLYPIISEYMKQIGSSASSDPINTCFLPDGNNGWKEYDRGQYIRYQVSNDSFEAMSTNDEGEHSDSAMYNSGNYTKSAEEEAFENMANSEEIQPQEEYNITIKNEDLFKVELKKFQKSYKDLVSRLKNSEKSTDSETVHHRLLKLLAGLVLFYDKNKANFVEALTKAGASDKNDTCWKINGNTYKFEYNNRVGKILNNFDSAGTNFPGLVTAEIRTWDLNPEKDKVCYIGAMDNDEMSIPEFINQITETAQKANYRLSGARVLIKLIKEPFSAIQKKPALFSAATTLLNHINSELDGDHIGQETDMVSKCFGEDAIIAKSSSDRTPFGGRQSASVKRDSFEVLSLGEALKKYKMFRKQLSECYSAEVKKNIIQSINQMKKIIENNGNAFESSEDNYYDEFVDSLRSEDEKELALSVICALRN